jgi:alpha-L-rhamnosidase
VKRLLLTCLFSLPLLSPLHAADIAVENLRCEYRENPLGIDIATPRLSWQLSSPVNGQRQSAYRILVASSPDLLKAEKGDLWDTGKVKSFRNLHIPYAGQALKPRQTCYWQVQTWDKDDQASAWSTPALWEIGLPEMSDWSDAAWIRLTQNTRVTSPLTQRAILTKGMTQPRMSEAYPSPLIRHEFTAKPDITRARAYICGIGYHELFINGSRCGDAVLEPGQTSYDVRAYYVTHDITTSLKTGANAVGIMLGNGFFGQNHAFNTASLNYAEPTVIAKIVIDYADGSSETVATNETWKTETGPILYDNVYGGETYDARLEKAGWNLPGYDDSKWAKAGKIPSPTKKLVAQMIPPIRAKKTYPTTVIEGKDGKWIFDLGQNIAGWAKIQTNAPAGTQLTLRFSEVLMPDGKEIDTATTGPFATGLEAIDIYVCKGGGNETWEPRFTYHGFRYVEVTGLTEKPSADFLQGVLVHTDAPKRGSFECSDETLNRIYRTSLITIEDNMHSVMEDCPHREKCGWLGDAHAVGGTTIYNYDMAQFWTKFVDDIETTLGRGGVTYWGQKATPGIPCNIAVGKRLCQEARPDWGSAYVLLPWYLYNYYGDTDVFTRHYKHLKVWINYVKGLRENGIVVRGYGDWCPPGGNTLMECQPNLTSTAFFYATLRIMSDFAIALKQPEDSAEYLKLAEETKTAFNQTFFKADTGGYGSQTADAVALRFAITPDDQVKSVAASLRKGVVDQHKGHAFVGIHGAKPLFTQLCEHGFEDVAIGAMKKETWPSYTYALNQGYTTWPEQFDQINHAERVGTRSLNHPMQSGFAAWYHESVGGIKPASPGYKQILLKPHGFTQMTWAKVHHDCPYGRIESSWKNEKGQFTLNVAIPPNASATVFVPIKSGSTAKEATGGAKFLRNEGDRAIFQVPSGRYEFVSEL